MRTKSSSAARMTPRSSSAHEELERGQDDTQIVELSKSWNEIWNEIYWR